MRDQGGQIELTTRAGDKVVVEFNRQTQARIDAMSSVSALSGSMNLSEQIR